MFENLNYAIVQLVHNFGAAAVVGFPVLGWYISGQASPVLRKFAWVVGLSWAVQAMSGAGFGAVSYYYYQTFPDLHGIAFAALLTKILCAAGEEIATVPSAASASEMEQVKASEAARAWNLRIIIFLEMLVSIFV